MDAAIVRNWRRRLKSRVRPTLCHACANPGSTRADVAASRHGDCKTALRIGDCALPLSLKTAVLHRAAALVGGAPSLRELLGATQEDFAAWYSGVMEPPESVFHRALGVVLDDLDEHAGG